MNAGQAERDRVQKLLDAAVERFGDAKIAAAIHAETEGQVRTRLEVERRRREYERRRDLAWWRQIRIDAAELGLERQRRKIEKRAEEILLAADPPIYDHWRRLYETGFQIEWERPKRRRRAA